MLLVAPLFGYGLAWIGHFMFEKNRPATFKHPLYSLAGDLVMFKDVVVGRIPLRASGRGTLLAERERHRRGDMSEVIHTHSARVTTTDGHEYRAVIMGEERRDGTWEGWIEFVPIAGGRPCRTGQETSQPGRRALEYWAGGLEPLYLEGAFSRAVRVESKSRITGEHAVGEVSKG